ncbi:MAG: RHS repeat-associated core domain-containing protein [Burkholderiaceae bacterium]
MEFRDSSYAMIGSTTASADFTTNYEQRSVTLTAPANAALVHIWAWNTGGSTGNLYVDDVSLVQEGGQGGDLAGHAFYAFADQINTVRVIARPDDGKAVWRWDHADPFGVAVADEDPNALGAFEFGQWFPGQIFDAETGLHYNYFRDYDPRVGRYTQGDPIGLQGGIGPYTYVANQPSMFLISNESPLLA